MIILKILNQRITYKESELKLDYMKKQISDVCSQMKTFGKLDSILN